ncbi:MAG: DUF4286 family protein [Oricola sp.]|jgi:antibiotic biosynthesis monooxygenase (ABM) superfamily enzyme|nr:DUF4286 family protein [Oricola sp.]
MTLNKTADDASVYYEVVTTVAPEIRDAYLDWLGPHVDELLRIDGFVSGEIFVNTENELEITSSYRLRDMAAMNAYLEGPAKAMRADGVSRFGDKIQARRRILKKYRPSL